MQSVGADQFAVATVDEGVELLLGIESLFTRFSEPPVTSIQTSCALTSCLPVYTVDLRLPTEKRPPQLTRCTITWPVILA